MRDQGVQILALCDLGRYPAPQYFGGFMNTELSKGLHVDIEGDLSLEVDGGKVLPTLRARIVPGQEEDLLISAGVMDEWQVTPEPKSFTCYGLGVQIPRMYPLDTGNALLRMVHAEIVEPGQEKTVRVQMIRASEEDNRTGLMWVEPLTRDLARWIWRLLRVL